MAACNPYPGWSRLKLGHGELPEPTWPDTGGPQAFALSHPDPRTRTVSPVTAATTANITMFAVTAYVGDREAHIREVEQHTQNLPEDSYGRRKPPCYAARETRVAAAYER